MQLKTTEPGKVERKKRDKLERIIDAAKHAFGTQSFADVRMDRIARAAQVAKGTVFLYAATKEELLFLAFRDDLEAMLFRSLEPLPGERIDDWLTRHLIECHGHIQSSPGLGRTMIRALGWAGPTSFHIRDFSQLYEDALAEKFERYRARGTISRTFAAGLLARFVVALFFGLQRRWVVELITFDELKAELVDQLGLLLSAIKCSSTDS